MYFLFFRAFKLYISAFINAFKFDHTAPLRPIRILFLLFLFPLFILLQIIHAISLILDNFLFSNYKNRTTNKALFVIGIPRSGTTFIHRRLSQSLDATTFSTWEAIFAPSICEKYVVKGLAFIDRMFGKIISRSINWMIQLVGGNFHDIHTVLLEEPEEDYLTLLPIGACFILLFAFPNSKELCKLIAFEQFSKKEQYAILNFYKSIIQRHLYFQKGDPLFLSKNAAFSSWLPYLKKIFPNAKFILSIREPQTAISSQLSALKSARQLFGTDPKGTLSQSIILSAFKHSYKSIYEFTKRSPSDDYALIHQEALQKAPNKQLLTSLETIGIAVPKAFQFSEDSKKASKHQHRAYSIEKGHIDSSIYKHFDLICERFPK